MPLSAHLRVPAGWCHRDAVIPVTLRTAALQGRVDGERNHRQPGSGPAAQRLPRHVQRCGPTPAAFMKFELFHIQLNVDGLVIRQSPNVRRDMPVINFFEFSAVFA
jgi:hypothetical protein